MGIQRCPGCDGRLKDLLTGWDGLLAPAHIHRTREHVPVPTVDEALAEWYALLCPPPVCDLCGVRHEGGCLEHALDNLNGR